MKNKCCKHYEEKKACKDCPVLAVIRMTDHKIKRKEVGSYLAATNKQNEETRPYA